MSRKLCLTSAFALLWLAPAPAADLKKYMPDKASMYVHINLKQLMTAPVVRKTIPKAVEKYGDQLLPLMQIAKQFNPAAPDIPEEEVKKGLSALKKEENIAAGLDKAKDVVTDILVAGDADDDEGASYVVLIKVPNEVTADAVAAMTKFVPPGQMKIKEHKKDQARIFEFEMPPPAVGVALFLLVPEPSVLCLSLSKETAEASVDRAAGKTKSEIKPELAALIAKRKPTDFVFAAGIKGSGDEKEMTVGSIVLTQDISGQASVTYATEEKAKAQADELKRNIDSMTAQLKEFLSDKKDVLDAVLQKLKTKHDGKTVSAEFVIPGTAIEKMLAKDG
jgi:hypothetical protein